MKRHVVVAFRMPPAAMAAGAEGAYLPRARSLCARGEALGGRLVAWSAFIVAMGWDPESVEEALLLATSLREDAKSPDHGWAVGVAEGELEPLAPDGARMQLAWGQALLLATTLSRVARGGEVLVDGDVTALRRGQLSLLGARTATDAGLEVRGWRLDLEHPWKRPPEGARPDENPDGSSDGSLDGNVGGELAETQAEARSTPSASSEGDAPGEAQKTSPGDFEGGELSTAEVLAIVESSASLTAVAPPAPKQPRGGRLAHRVRRLAAGDKSTDAMEAIAELRRERARVEAAGTSSSRCQAALALAMTLAIAGRDEDALLEALDALGRAREAGDPKAIDACTALLAKLYSRAGHVDEAAALLRGA